MENKKTTELLDLLDKYKGDNYDSEQVETIMEELKSREPFFSILMEDLDDSLPKTVERVNDIESDIKKLKRHKHDGKNGDVVVRI